MLEYVYDEGRNAEAANIIKDKIVTTFRGMDSSLSQAVLQKTMGSYLYKYLSPRFLQQPVSMKFDNIHPLAHHGENYAR